jgi:hypothetical protein
VNLIEYTSKWLLLCLVVLAPAAHADLMSVLNDGTGCSGTCSPAPFGTVTVSQFISGENPVANKVVVTVTLNSGVGFVNTGGPHHALGFNILGDPGILISGLTTGFSVNSLSPTSLSGYGSFDYTIDCSGGTSACGNGGNNPNPGPLRFNVTLTGAGTCSYRPVLFQTARATFMLPTSLWPTNGIFKLVGAVCNALG